MHIPDGFIDGKTAAATAALAVAGVGFSLRNVKRELPARKVPLLGLAAAFLFAAQMVNFPVYGGTSGHLIGGALVAALLGPSAAVVVVTTVLIVQCLLFADGGLVALGANVFNMAIVDSVSGYAIYRLVSRLLPGARGRVSALAFAGWCSAVLASICCAGQLAWSGTMLWSAVFPAMVNVHMLIGLGEGVISALVFLGIQRTRPEMVNDSKLGDPAPRWGQLAAFGLLASLGLAIFVAPFACPWPDGLEAVAAKLGFQGKAGHPFGGALAPGYQAPGVHWAVGATAIAGAAGAVIVFLLAVMLGRFLVPPPEKTRPANP
jgi:cobalt/nickel transport system permease protein